MTDLDYMGRCLELAQKALGNTYPNPIVGALIVHNGKIIGEGYHHAAGKDHAEINAINQIEDRTVIKESTIYVSLEPCSHYGRTPPCALRLKELGFRRVVIGILDPSKKVHGKGIAILRDAEIEVTSNILQAEALESNKRFFTSQIKHRPFVILKWAESGDGYLDHNFQPSQISNPLLSQWVHHLRSQEQAILVGTKTAQIDNPSLTVRHLKGNNPIRVVIDLDLKIPTSANLYDAQAPTLVFNRTKSEIRGTVEFIKVDPINLIADLLRTLNLRGIQSLLVEGGAKMHTQFIELGIWDCAYQIINPKAQFQNGTRAPRIPMRANTKLTIAENELYYYLNS